MTIQEMGAIMDILTVAYPQYYRNVSESDKFNASCLWAEMFADESVDIVKAAVKRFIATDTKGFPPVIGIIKDQITKITHGQEKSELEAWAEVKKALKNSNYHAVEEFDKLDQVIQRIVGGPSQLREWAMADNDTLDSVIASNFQRSYRAISKNERERMTLPPSVSDLVKQLAASKALAPDPGPESDTVQKALPISAEATVNQIKREIGRIPQRDIPKPLSPDEFEKKRAAILAELNINEFAG